MRDWRQKKECCGGVPYDYACYPINAVGHFAQSIPIRVNALGSEGKYGTITRLYGVIEFQNGRVGIVSSSRKGGENQELYILGSLGAHHVKVAWVPQGNSTIERSHMELWPNMMSDIYYVSVTNPYVLQFENFVNVVMGRSNPVMPLVQSVVNTFVIEAMLTSIIEKRVVELHIPDFLQKKLLDTWK